MTNGGQKLGLLSSSIYVCNMGRLILVTGGSRRTVENYSRHRQRSCEDFGDYLFIQTSLLEPSRKSLFIQRDIKILLSREYLITIHKSRSPLHCLLSSSHVSGFAHTGTLLLTLLDSSIDRIMESFCSEEQRIAGSRTPKKPLWWRLRNFRAPLLRDVNLLHGIAVAGGSFLVRSFFESIRAQIHLLTDVTTRLLSRMGSPVEVPSMQMHKKIS